MFNFYYQFRNGPEWWRIRSEFQKSLSSPKNVKNLLPDMDDITKEFLTLRQPENLKSSEINFMDELARLNLEGTLK